jgi:hypothetical protein
MKKEKINKHRRPTNRVVLIVLLGVLLISATGCSPQSGQKLFEGQIAALLEGLGNHQFPITTNDTLAQRYVNLFTYFVAHNLINKI